MIWQVIIWMIFIIAFCVIGVRIIKVCIEIHKIRKETKSSGIKAVIEEKEKLSKVVSEFNYMVKL